MLMTVTYIGVICLVVIYLIFIAYIKFTYPFWSRLNMHHSYNILNYHILNYHSLNYYSLNYYSLNNLNIINLFTLNDFK